MAWAALYNGLVECVCRVDLWVLCAICGIGYKLQVASRRLVSLRNWMVHVWAWSCSSLPVQLPSLYEDFRLKRTHPLIMGNERGVVR